MKNESTQSVIDAHIRQVINRQIMAVRNKDINQALANYDHDVLSFDVADPLRFMGIDAIRKRLEEWFSRFQGPIENEISDLKIDNDILFIGAGHRASIMQKVVNLDEHPSDVTRGFVTGNPANTTGQEAVEKPILR